MKNLVLKYWLVLKVLILVFALMSPVIPAQAANLKLEISLVWGSNEEKLPDPKYHRVNDELGKKLQKIFKWKHYFLIKKQEAEVPSRATKKFKVSDKCDVEITEMEGPRVEVKLYGEGKLINRTIKSLTKDEMITIAGDDKNETAWFVIIKLLEER
ncbi:MAG: hypothetical protein ACP5T0_05740 [Verrucomicrobiia bacterium]